MIIVEGVDGAGKTNLVQKLCKDFGLEPEKRVVDKDTNPIDNISLKKWVEDDLESWPKAAIYDRHRLISEPIYAPIMRGRLADGFEDPFWFTKQLGLFWKHHPIIIYCMPPPEVVVANVAREDTENEAICKAIAALYWLYHTNFCQNAHRANVVLWDYTQDDYDSTLHYIRFMLKEEFSRYANVINRYFPVDRDATSATKEVLRERPKRFRRK